MNGIFSNLLCFNFRISSFLSNLHWIFVTFILISQKWRQNIKDKGNQQDKISSEIKTLNKPS